MFYSIKLSDNFMVVIVVVVRWKKRHAPLRLALHVEVGPKPACLGSKEGSEACPVLLLLVQDSA